MAASHEPNHATADARAEPPLCAGFDPRPRQPKLKLPPGATDCHAHICGPKSRYAYYSERIYTPPDCLLPDYQHTLTTLGIERAVLVQPSVYGTDNTVMLEAMQTAGATCRGVAVVADDVSAGGPKGKTGRGGRGGG